MFHQIELRIVKHVNITKSDIHSFKYSYYSIGQGKSLPILCGPPISVEIEINYPYLHC